MRIILSFNGTNGCNGAIGSIGPGPILYGNDAHLPYGLSFASGLVQFSVFGFYSIEQVATGPVLAPDGTLYGVNGLGTNANGGTLYSVTNGALGYLSSFGGALGAAPLALPILTSAGALIDTATIEGLCPDCGTIWEYTP